MDLTDLKLDSGKCSAERHIRHTHEIILESSVLQACSIMLMLAQHLIVHMTTKELCTSTALQNYERQHYTTFIHTIWHKAVVSKVADEVHWIFDFPLDHPSSKICITRYINAIKSQMRPVQKHCLPAAPVSQNLHMMHSSLTNEQTSIANVQIVLAKS